jgi:hypothetical protein
MVSVERSRHNMPGFKCCGVEYRVYYAQIAPSLCYGILNDTASSLRYFGPSRIGAAPEVIPNLTKWWCFCGQMTLRTMFAVV